MSIEAGLRALLAADATIAGMVGGRIYPITLPQSPTYPALTYHRASTVRERHLRGPLGYAEVRERVHCWARSYGGAKDLAEAVRHLLDGYRGAAGAYEIGGAAVETEIDLYDDNADVYRVVVDVMLPHRES